MSDEQPPSDTDEAPVTAATAPAAAPATATPAAAPDARGPLYELSKLARRFSRGGTIVEALRGIDLVIQRGEMLSLEGPSGSGKTTLLQLLGALDGPTAGTIRFADRDLSGLSDRELTKIRATQIGFVFQHFNLIPTLTATENVAVAMFPNHVRSRARVERAHTLLETVGLGHRLEHLPSRLSGGEQQRVAIARALANSPSVIIADEPTGNLDSDTAREVMATLHQLQQTGNVTIVVATHDESVSALTSRRIRMRDGRVKSDTAA